jgi:hypothetical protein
MGKSYQKFIHFPKSGMLAVKDNLCRLMKKMKVSLYAQRVTSLQSY